MDLNRKKVSVLVIGGGITGAQAALDLVNLGYHIHLVEKSPTLGGLSRKLYRTYPLCFCCRIPVLFTTVEWHSQITIHYSTQILEISGEAGNFEVRVLKKEGASILSVAAIILATGLESIDARLLPMYHYGDQPNIITGLEFEQLLNPFGPTRGVIKCSSNGKIPQKIAWLQCIGSREEKKANLGYCSSVCCMYALKQAINAKEKLSSSLDAAIFYIDLRTYGRFYETYIEKAKTLGVRFIRSRVSHLVPLKDTEGLCITYVTEEGKRFTETFDMVVLSAGLKPSRETIALAQKLSLKINSWGFIKTSPFSPVKTSIPGVYVCGTIQEPKDIYDSLIQAGAVATEVSTLVKNELNTEFQPLTNEDEAPNIGVFICRCNGQIDDVLDTSAIKDFAAGFSHVSYTHVFKAMCISYERELLVQIIKAQRLNRVVFAGCSNRLMQSFFEEVSKEAGISPYLYEVVNLREHCSFIHEQATKAAIEEAKTLIRIAVAKLQVSKHWLPVITPVKKAALVVGSGIAGLVAAENLVKQGIKVHLLESGKQLGKKIPLELISYQGYEKAYPEELLKKATRHPLIHIHLNTEVLEVTGCAGNFKTKIRENGQEYVLEHGVAILTDGGEEARIHKYLHGKDPRILNALEFESKLKKDLDGIRNIVIIQCVGSRCSDYPYCSRICCTRAMCYAIEIRRINPNINVYILYRDIRTYGFAEALYRQAREAGVVFVRYNESQKPEVKLNGLKSWDRLLVNVKDCLLGEYLSLKADIVVLNTGIWPAENNARLAEVFKIPLAADGFFKWSTNKLRPVESNRDGVFICGLATGPKLLPETVASAQAVVAKALAILKQGHIQTWPIIATVDESRCDGCAYCIDPCPFQAIKLVEYIRDGQIKKTVEVDEGVCQGCGVCQATCPKEAIDVRTFTTKQLKAMVETALSIQ